MTRSTSDRVPGGVAGGLGRYFDVDPILFRIAFVVLTLVGGAGAVAYIGAWLFIPAEGAGPAGTNRNRALAIVGAIILALVALPFLGPVVFLGGTLIPIALVVLLVILLARAASGDGNDIGQVLARVALVLLVVVLGAIAVVVIGAAASMGGGVVMAGLLVIAGVALVVGAFVGGARWLILPALLIAIPVAVVAAADLDVDGGIGDREYRPTTAAEVRPNYDLGMGELIVDLRGVDLPAGRTDLRLNMGMGQVLVYVPDDVCVASDVRVGAGYARVLDRDNSGLDVDWREAPMAGASVPRLVIDADVGMGALEVVRRYPGDLDFGDERPWRDRFGGPRALDDPANVNDACVEA